MPNRGRKQKGDGTNADPSGEKTTTTKDHNVVEQVEKKVLPVPDKLILRVEHFLRRKKITFILNELLCFIFVALLASLLDEELAMERMFAVDSKM